MQRLQNEILAAFPLFPQPEFGLHPTCEILPEAPILRAHLAGKDWQNLDSDFLKKYWSAFGYLNDENFRYFLPSLLMRSLEGDARENEWIHLTIILLKADSWQIYLHGRDENFERRIAVFDESQKDAIRSFLGWVCQESPYKHCGAQVLKWGWSHQSEHPALKVADAIYHELRHFVCPKSQDPKIQALLTQIHSAFAATPAPKNDELYASDNRYADDEAAQIAIELRGVQWQKAHPVLLASIDSALNFLPDAAFRYFLPAFLVADLLMGDETQDENFDSNAYPVYCLTRSFARHSKDQQKLDQFSPDERAAIIAYLRFRAERDDYERENINRALKNYWLQNL